MKDEARELYMNSSTSCLAMYQMIEAGLRTVLPLLYARANGALPEGMRYKWSEKDLGKASLGKLIDRLDQIYDADPDLVADLRKTVEERNKLAHWALAYHFHLDLKASDYLGKADEVQAKSRQLEPLVKKLIKLFGDLEANNALHRTQ